MCPLVVLQSECGLQNGKKERCPSTSFPWTPNLSETLQCHVTDCYDRWYFWTGPSTLSMSENSVNLSSLRYVIVKHVVIRQWGCQTAREPKPALYFTWGEALSHTRGIATSHQYEHFLKPVLLFNLPQHYEKHQLFFIYSIKANSLFITKQTVFCLNILQLKQWW